MKSGARTTGPGAGILFFSLGLFFFSVNDALGKWLVADYSVGQIILLRSIGTLLFLVPVLWHHRSRLVMPDQWGLHLLRVLVIATDTFCFFFSTKALPLADVMTFYLAAPLIVTILSIVVLGERVGVSRWAAVIVGFLGVVVAMKPTGAAFSPWSLVALAGATLFATSITITRKLRDTHWLIFIMWQLIGSSVFGAVTSPFGWITPSALDVGLMILVGVTSTLCFVSVNRALRLAPASLLAPFQYTSIIWGVALGWLIWRDLPSLNVVVGIAIIVGSGLCIWYHEQSRGPAARFSGG